MAKKSTAGRRTKTVLVKVIMDQHGHYAVGPARYPDGDLMDGLPFKCLEQTNNAISTFIIQAKVAIPARVMGKPVKERPIGGAVKKRAADALKPKPSAPVVLGPTMDPALDW